MEREERSLPALVTNLNSTCVLKGHPLRRETAATILVVEDVEEIATNMERALVQRDYEVLCALDAEQAIRMAERALPVVVLTDSDLPTLDRLLELVSEHRSLKEVPIVVIDVDELQLRDQRIKVLQDFEALDELVDSLQSNRRG